MTLALTSLATLLLATVWALASRHWLPAVLTIAAAAAWTLTNSPLEGPVLWTVTPAHGLTVADLLTPLCAGIGVARLVRALRRCRGMPLLSRTEVPLTGGSESGRRLRRD